MATLVEQGVEAVFTTANLVRVGIAGEIDAGGRPLPLPVPGGQGGVHETVFMFALAVQQVQGQLRIEKIHAHAAERFHPAPQAVAEGQVGIHLARAVATPIVLLVVRRQGLRAVHPCKLLQAAFLRIPGLLFELVENDKQGLRRHALFLVDLVVEVVAIALRAGKRVAPLDHVDETVFRHPAFQLQQGGMR